MPAFPSLPHVAAASAVHTLVGLGVDYVTHPIRTEIAARYQWSDLATRYREWVQRPFVIPEPGDLLDALSKAKTDPGDWIKWGLLRHGIVSEDNYTPPGRNAVDTSVENWLWDVVLENRRSVPGPGVWAEMNL